MGTLERPVPVPTLERRDHSKTMQAWELYKEKGVGGFFIYFIREWRRWFIVALLCVFPFFFVGGSSYDDPRSIKELWNLGHFFYFAFLIFVLDSSWCSTRRSLTFRVFATFFTVLLLGLGIELVQLNIADRYFSWGDVVRDVSGGVTALLWKVGRRRPRRQLILCWFVAMVLVIYCFFPFGAALADDYRSYRDFPLLAGFESKAELGRWEGERVGLCMVATPRVQGSFSGKITLTTDEYSGLSLRHFPGDWSGRSGLAFHVFNPGEKITVHYRVHDYLHRGDKQTYGDRFNGTTVLEYGWNEIVIPMADIINGPKDRRMDVTKIRGFGLFVMKQPERRVLYVDNVRLMSEGRWSVRLLFPRWSVGTMKKRNHEILLYWWTVTHNDRSSSL